MGKIALFNKNFCQKQNSQRKSKKSETENKNHKRHCQDFYKFFNNLSVIYGQMQFGRESFYGETKNSLFSGVKNSRIFVLFHGSCTTWNLSSVYPAGNRSLKTLFRHISPQNDKDSTIGRIYPHTQEGNPAVNTVSKKMDRVGKIVLSKSKKLGKHVKDNPIKNNSFQKTENLYKNRGFTSFYEAEADYVKKPNFPDSNQNKAISALPGTLSVSSLMDTFITSACFHHLAHRKNLKNRAPLQIPNRQIRNNLQKSYPTKDGQGGKNCPAERRKEMKEFEKYLEEALRELEKENCNFKKCEKALEKAVETALNTEENPSFKRLYLMEEERCLN